MARPSDSRVMSGARVVVLIALIAIGIARIVLTYPAVSETLDEGSHITAGVEWLDQGTYLVNQENPPLPRVALGIGPVLSGAVQGDSASERAHVLRGGSDYTRTLHLARLGNLPFFVVGALVAWLWGVYLFGHGVGLLAAALFTTLPPVLGLAGLATTDMATAATVGGAMLALTLWLERPTKKRSALLGLAFALAVLSKFNAVLFLSVAAACLVGVRWLLDRKRANRPAAEPRAYVRSLWLSLGIACLAIWAGYRFSIGSIRGPESRPYNLIDHIAGTQGTLHDWAYRAIEAPIYPAPELAGGLGQMIAHARDGKRAYLLGETSEAGFWLFFPVAFVVKTPLAFLILLAAGAIATMRSAWRERQWTRAAPLVSGLAVMLAVLPSNINIGLRYVLPMYVMLSVVASVGVVTLGRPAARQRFAVRLGSVALAIWYLWSSAGAHPAYLSYFNELAGDHPEEILADSDLDWGQDVGRLSEELARRGIGKVQLALFSRMDLSHFEWPEQTSHLEEGDRATGWIAASIFRIKVLKDVAWLEAYEPVMTVGRSIRLYHVPEASGE